MNNDISTLVDRLRQGDRRAVARLITFVENGGADIARKILEKIYPDTGDAYIIGLTGAPGSGKSTLTNQLAGYFLDQGLKVGIICVDPTSPFSGGALLGDRIRMKKNFTRKNLFIRSMANRGKLGGLARHTKETIHILDAFGCDIILVETVGVGQSEIDIFKSAHTTLVLVVPGLGDEIQAIKAGIMEITDVFVVNKCDLTGADQKVAHLNSMLDLSEKIDVDPNRRTMKVIRSKGWRPPVVKTNARSGEHLPKLIAEIEKHRNFLKRNGIHQDRMRYRYKHYVVDILKFMAEQNIEEIIFADEAVEPYITQLLNHSSEANPYSIAEKIYRRFIKKSTTSN